MPIIYAYILLLTYGTNNYIYTDVLRALGSELK